MGFCSKFGIGGHPSNGLTFFQHDSIALGDCIVGGLVVMGKGGGGICYFCVKRTYGKKKDYRENTGILSQCIATLIKD